MMRHESPDVAPMHQIYFQSSSKDTTQNSTPEKASLKASSLVGLSATPTAEHMCLFLFHTVTAINIRIRSLLSQAMEVDLYFYLLNAAIKKKKKRKWKLGIILFCGELANEGVVTYTTKYSPGNKLTSLSKRNALSYDLC